MKKLINYSVKLVLIILIVLVANTSHNIYETKIENESVNNTINLTTMALKVVEINKSDKLSAKDTFTGDLTGYAFNCPLCGGTLGCKPSYNIKDGTVTYPDKDYGVVRIVASSKNLPCGSIVRFKSNRVSENETFAIVLDRGVRGNALDLLVPTEEYASKYIGRSSITYDVLRNGWGNES